MSGNTLVLFSGDNGTNRKISTEMRDGKIIPGGKGTLQDTGSWVPLLAKWPGVLNPENDTPESKAARERLQGILNKLHPQG